MTTVEQTKQADADISIEVNGVSKFFGELAAVNDLSFSVNKGEGHWISRTERLRQDHHNANAHIVLYPRRGRNQYRRS